MADIAIFTHLKSPRVNYTINHVFSRMLGWQVQWLVSESDFPQGPVLVYGRGSSSAFQVTPSGALEVGEALDDRAIGQWLGRPVLYPVDSGDLPFDLFAFVFFLLSRAEEYGSLKDEHGRFAEEQAWVVKQGIEQTAVLDELVLAFAAELRTKWPSLPVPQRQFRYVPTFDLDNGFKYLGRPWWRSTGAAARDLLNGRFGELKKRLSVLRKKTVDPYYLVPEISNHLANAASSYCFCLVADRGPNDHAVPPSAASMLKKLRELDKVSTLGLHPSYGSMDQTALLEKELARLGEIAESPIHASRQHFLRFNLPTTYRELLAYGIGEEHSMGFSKRPGFRAGTCSPFPWYDLEAEEETTLMVHPFGLMDSAVYHYCSANEKSPLEVCRNLVSSVIRVQGNFECIWHERFMAYGIGKITGQQLLEGVWSAIRQHD